MLKDQEYVYCGSKYEPDSYLTELGEDNMK